MCKAIKNILWPLNVLGKKIRSFKIPLENPPYNDRTITIMWTGKRLDICYTQQARNGIHAVPPRPFRLRYEDGDNTTETFTIKQLALMDRRVWVDAFYIKATDVKLLVVDGEILIENDIELVKYYADQFQPILGVNNPEQPDESLPETDNILTYYANKFKAIFGIE